jgi:hypothetical protein
LARHHSPLPTQSVPSFPLEKRSFSTFKNLTHHGTDIWILQRSSSVRDLGQAFSCALDGSSDNYLISIGIHYEICIVRNNDHLATFPRFAKMRNEFHEYRFRVKVLFGLINDEGPPVLSING